MKEQHVLEILWEAQRSGRAVAKGNTAAVEEAERLSKLTGGELSQYVAATGGADRFFKQHSDEPVRYSAVGNSAALKRELDAYQV
jgi:hypothetical protein